MVLIKYCFKVGFFCIKNWTNHSFLFISKVRRIEGLLRHTCPKVKKIQFSVLTYNWETWIVLYVLTEFPIASVYYTLPAWPPLQQIHDTIIRNIHLVFDLIPGTELFKPLEFPESWELSRYLLLCKATFGPHPRMEAGCQENQPCD